MEKEYVVALVRPEKYRQLLMDLNGYIVYPPKRAGKTEYTKKVNTLYNLPIEIAPNIDEDIKLLTKEEYEEYRLKEMKSYEEFMRQYEPDIEWRNR